MIDFSWIITNSRYIIAPSWLNTKTSNMLELLQLKSDKVESVSHHKLITIATGPYQITLVQVLFGEDSELWGMSEQYQKNPKSCL